MPRRGPPRATKAPRPRAAPACVTREAPGLVVSRWSPPRRAPRVNKGLRGAPAPPPPAPGRTCCPAAGQGSAPASASAAPARAAARRASSRSRPRGAPGHESYLQRAGGPGTAPTARRQSWREPAAEPAAAGSGGGQGGGGGVRRGACIPHWRERGCGLGRRCRRTQPGGAAGFGRTRPHIAGPAAARRAHGPAPAGDPHLYTSAALLMRPSISTSCGMWVTVPYVRVDTWLSPSTVRASPKSDTWRRGRGGGEAGARGGGARMRRRGTSNEGAGYDGRGGAGAALRKEEARRACGLVCRPRRPCPKAGWV
jgi:hypothetical protein